MLCSECPALLFESSFFRTRQPASYFLDFVTQYLLVMLGMLVGHAGDVENDAGDVDGLSILRENAVKYEINPK